MSGFDWPGLMRLGLHVLRLPPDRFWRLSPVELLVMLGVEGGPPPVTRARLDALISRFPDEQEGP